MTTITQTQTRTRLDLGNLPIAEIGPLTTGQDDFATFAAREMAQVHNCMMWAWNSIYQQAPLIVEKDYADFIFYALAWHKLIEMHHDGEEESLYPQVAKEMGQPDFFNVAIGEHASFHAGLDQYKAYLTECQAKPEIFSGTKLIEIMDSFGEAMHTHMTAEPHLLLKMKGDEVVLKKIWENHTKEAIGSASPFTLVPIVVVNRNVVFENGSHANFPEGPPAPVLFFLFQIAPRWHSRYWRFGSTTYSGKPQTLLALRDSYGK